MSTRNVITYDDALSGLWEEQVMDIAGRGYDTVKTARIGPLYMAEIVLAVQHARREAEEARKSEEIKALKARLAELERGKP